MKNLLVIPLLLLAGCTPPWGDTSPAPAVVGTVTHVAQPRTMVSAPAPLVQLQWVNATNCYLPMTQRQQFFKLSAQYAGRLTALTSAQLEYRAEPLAERMKLRAPLAERTRETVAAIKLD